MSWSCSCGKSEGELGEGGEMVRCQKKKNILFMWNFFFIEVKELFSPCCSELLLLLEEGCASVSVSQYLICCSHLLTVFILKSKECFC